MTYCPVCQPLHDRSPGNVQVTHSWCMQEALDDIAKWLETREAA